MKSMITTLLLTLAVAMTTTSGCALAPLADGYQFGDATRSIINLKHDYCQATTASGREIILARARALDPDWKPVCSTESGYALSPLADGYQSGDATRSIINLRHDYCQATTASRREIILARARALDPDWKPLCGSDDGRQRTEDR